MMRLISATLWTANVVIVWVALRATTPEPLPRLPPLPHWERLTPVEQREWIVEQPPVASGVLARTTSSGRPISGR